ncbi:MAG: XkdF-like putative serine protease domain-containing protein [bacterium]|nr:XkdF-like putative serine protease domain-containing protein [bacterium]
MSRRVNDSYEVVMERLRSKVYRELDNHDSSQGDITDFYVIHTFDDAVIAKDEVSGKLYEVPYMRSDTQVYLGQPREVENMYVQKRLEAVGLDISNKGLDICELTGPIVMKNARKRLAYAAVLVPGEEDSDGETVTKEKIEEAAHEWMQSYRNVDLQHTLNNVAVPVESYVLPMDMEVNQAGVKTLLPAGTWVLASKVLDDATWSRVENGELTGYSVMGIRRTTLEAVSKNKDVALKKTLLRDLGPDWIACAVSIVDEPAVPKAKFFALKAKDKSKNWYQKVKEILMPAAKDNSEQVVETVAQLEEAHKAGRRFSEETYSRLKQAYETLAELVTEAEQERGGGDVGFSEGLQKSNKEKEDGDMSIKPEELKNLIDEAVKSAVEPIQQELEALKAKADEAETTEETEGQEEAENTEYEAFKSQVMEKLEALETKVGKKSATPKSLKGQDGEEVGGATKSQHEDRDLFGRKRNVKEGK